MIKVERINGKTFFLNEQLIEIVESTPDTIITLTTGHKYILKNQIEEVISMIRMENNT
jgi:flagellar protein FlbD